MSNALILGGTSGLGKEIAGKCEEHDITPIVAGRSVQTQLHIEPYQLNIDLSDVVGMERAYAILRGLGRFDQIDFIFWLAGKGYQGDVIGQAYPEINDLYQTMVIGPLWLIPLVVADFKVKHLVTVASTSAWKLRANEAAYGGAKAAQAQITRNLQVEFSQKTPEFKATLINPGGMSTSFWDGSTTDTSKFMKAAAVADIIMNQVTAQETGFVEMQIQRDSEGNPVVEYGAKAPQ